MKKIILILMVAILFIAGCENKEEEKKQKENNKQEYKTMTCTNNTDSIANLITVNIEYDNNIIKNIKYTYDIKEEGKTMISMLVTEFEKDFKDVSGVTSKYSNNTWIQTYDFEKINLENYKNAKTNYLNYLSSDTEKNFDYINNDNMLLDSYKNIELNKYICE